MRLQTKASAEAAVKRTYDISPVQCFHSPSIGRYTQVSERRSSPAQ